MNVFRWLFDRSKQETHSAEAAEAEVPQDPVQQLARLRKELATSEWEAAVAPMHAANYAAKNAFRLRAEIARLEKLIASQSESS